MALDPFGVASRLTWIVEPPSRSRCSLSTNGTVWRAIFKPNVTRHQGSKIHAGRSRWSLKKMHLRCYVRHLAADLQHFTITNRFAEDIKMTGIRYFTPLLVASLMLSSAAEQAKAATLNNAVGDVVGKLCRYLKGKGETQISVGQFVGPPQIAATSGPGIAKVFHEHFESNGISVATRANIGLKGEYTLTKTPSFGVGVKIKGSLVDAFGDVLTDFSFDAANELPPGTVETIVDRHEEVAQLLGVTTELHPQDRDSDRNKDLKNQILKPQLYVDGTKCGSSATSPYRIEVLIHGRPAPIKVDDGLGFVHIDRGDIYSVKIYNDSDYDAAVRLSIDGLSVFTFSDLCEPDGTPKYKFYIVPAHKVVELKGWHKTNSVVNSFQVTKYADSAAASINHTQDLGTITAVFSAAWPKNGTPSA